LNCLNLSAAIRRLFPGPLARGAAGCPLLETDTPWAQFMVFEQAMKKNYRKFILLEIIV